MELCGFWPRSARDPSLSSAQPLPMRPGRAVMVNGPLLHAIAEAHRNKSDLTLHVGVGENRRTLFILGGQLIASQSILREDRLGEFLAAQGRLDHALLEPLSAAARSQG